MERVRPVDAAPAPDHQPGHDRRRLHQPAAGRPGPVARGPAPRRRRGAGGRPGLPRVAVRPAGARLGQRALRRGGAAGRGGAGRRAARRRHGALGPDAGPQRRDRAARSRSWRWGSRPTPGCGVRGRGGSSPRAATRRCWRSCTAAGSTSASTWHRGERRGRGGRHGVPRPRARARGDAAGQSLRADPVTAPARHRRAAWTRNSRLVWTWDTHVARAAAGLGAADAARRSRPPAAARSTWRSRRLRPEPGRLAPVPGRSPAARSACTARGGGWPGLRQTTPALAPAAGAGALGDRRSSRCGRAQSCAPAPEAAYDVVDAHDGSPEPQRCWRWRWRAAAARRPARPRAPPRRPTARARRTSPAAPRRSCTLSYSGTEGATGHLELTWRVRNNSAEPHASLRGYPGARLLDERGRALPLHVGRATGSSPIPQSRPRAVALKPGASARFGISLVTNNEYKGARVCRTAAAAMLVGAGVAIALAAAVSACGRRASRPAATSWSSPRSTSSAR